MNHNKLPANIGSKLKRLREMKRYSQQYVADAVSISRRTLINIEANASDTSMGTLISLANVFGLSITDLIEKSEVELVRKVLEQTD